MFDFQKLDVYQKSKNFYREDLAILDEKNLDERKYFTPSGFGRYTSIINQQYINLLILSKFSANRKILNR
jgi:hypothetical protein